MMVPPARQCTLPGCERAAVDPVRPGALCESHADTVDTDEPVTRPEESRTKNQTESFGNETKTRGGGATQIPGVLHRLGASFVPIEPCEKRHIGGRDPKDLAAHDDPVFGAHLEIGWNYGVVCRSRSMPIDTNLSRTDMVSDSDSPAK